MSKLSCFYIVIIVAGLVFMGGVRWYRLYEHIKQQRQAAAQSDEIHSLTRKPIPPVMQLPVFERITGGEAAEIYLEDVPLSGELSKEQARQTISSILNDYKEDVALQDFYKELQVSTGEKISLADLSGEQMQQWLDRYPQITQIIQKHTQNPAFSKVLQEIFSNPQFVHSVMILQQKKRN